MDRPLSAPGWVERPNNGEVEEDGIEATSSISNHSLASSKIEFIKMEKRTVLENQAYNRGHKLNLEELPSNRGQLFKAQKIKATPIPDESEFEEFESVFVELQHYSNSPFAAGLTNTEIRLLHSFWGHFGNSVESLRRTLGLPEKLVDASDNSTVRTSLAGSPISALSNALILMIEECQKDRIKMLHFVEKLDQMFISGDHDEQVPNGSIPNNNNNDGRDHVPSILPDEREQALSVLALCQHHLQSMELFMAELSAARFELKQALDYGHLIGRFLVKRIKKLPQSQQATPHPN